MKRALFALFVCALGISAGCATFSRQPFHKASLGPSSSGRPKKIALLQVRSPRELYVAGRGGVGYAFGLIGAAVEEANQESKSEELNSMLGSERSALGRELADSIQAELKKDGYSVVFLEYDRPLEKEGDDGARDYSQIATDADAILDVSFAVAGFVLESSDYVPWLLVRATLVSSKNKSRLYAEELTYGSDKKKDEHHYSSPPKYTYDDYDALLEKASEAGEGLRLGLPVIAAGIGADLR